MNTKEAGISWSKSRVVRLNLGRNTYWSNHLKVGKPRMFLWNNHFWGPRFRGHPCAPFRVCMERRFHWQSLGKYTQKTLSVESFLRVNQCIHKIMVSSCFGGRVALYIVGPLPPDHTLKGRVPSVWCWGRVSMKY